ncbi:MAG: prepilin peptidase [Chitinophagales bacterium]
MWLLILLGLVIGSFLNVLVHRVPRDESIAFPPSHCPACDHRLAPADLVPVASWLALRGRCRYCQAPIPWRYPAVELLNAAVYLLLYLRFGWRLGLLPYAVLTSLMVAVTFIDLDHQLLPDALTLPGLAAGLGFALFETLAERGYSHPFSVPNLPYLFDPLSFKAAVVGAAVGAGVILAIIWLSRGGMGYGDAKLLAMIGAFTGWRGALGTLFAGAILGSVVGIFLLATKRKGRRDPIPFGPFLVSGCLFILFADRLLLSILGRFYW